MLSDRIKEFIRAESKKLGFCICGFTNAEPLTDFGRYKQWLETDSFGTMAYLKREDTLAKRADPRVLLPEAQSICVLGVPMVLRPAGKEPEVASYAWYADYHETILHMAEKLVEKIRQRLAVSGQWTVVSDQQSVVSCQWAVDSAQQSVVSCQWAVDSDQQSADTNHHTSLLTSHSSLLISPATSPQQPVFLYRICIDSSPILERSLAVRAGLGWIGKSSMFIHPQYGSCLLLCEILLSIPIEPDTPYIKDGCGSCLRCTNTCPNHCIDPVSRTIRADRCISYLTIEHKGDFTPEQSKLVGSHLFGCDECLRVCPWNSHRINESPLPLAGAVPQLSDYDLSDTEFREKFRNSPVLRTKAKGLRRNIEAVIRNSKK